MKTQTQPTYTHEFVSSYVSENATLRAINAELLAALKRLTDLAYRQYGPGDDDVERGYKAIAKAESHEN